VTISGESGNYWRIGEARYVLKSDINIPATGIAVTPTSVEVAVTAPGNTAQLAKTLSPVVNGVSLGIGTVNWSSAATNTAIVDSVGKITAKSEGHTTVTAAIFGNTATANVTVYTTIPDVAGKMNKSANTYYGSNQSLSSGTINNGASVTISGQSGDYWRIGTRKYVRKADVYIPATALAISPTKATIYTTVGAKTIDMTKKLTPEISSGTVKWTSSNGKIAQVSQKGKV
jgi:hypothetical protein